MSEDSFKKPDGFKFGYFINDRGQNIRYGSIKESSNDKDGKTVSRGAVIIGPGYGETIEKYYEVINELSAEGYDVHIIDWMGQGGSDRKDLSNPNKPYDVPYFIEHHRDDLYKFATSIIQAQPTQKLFYLGFSMGGHIGMRFLNRYNYIFDAVSLNSPLFDLEIGNIERHALPLLTAAYRLRGKGDDYVPGGSEWSKLKYVFNGNNKTSDQKRYERVLEFFENKQDLRLGDVTVNWVHNILPSLKEANNHKRLYGILTPIHIAVAGQDEIVSVKAQKRAYEYMPNVRLVTYRDAKHELWIEKNEIRQNWISDIQEFLHKMNDHKIPPVRCNRQNQFVFLRRKKL